VERSTSSKGRIGKDVPLLQADAALFRICSVSRSPLAGVLLPLEHYLETPFEIKQQTNPGWDVSSQPRQHARKEHF
jgi:hypothetical protein